MGIIGGNSFFTILGRSFLGTFILSALLLGAFIIIKKIISEIPVPNTEEGQSEQDISSDATPNNIDIVIDKENPYETEGADIVSDNENSSLPFDNQANGSSPAENLVEEVEEDAIGDINSLDSKQSDNEVIEVMSDNPDMPTIDSNTELFDNIDKVKSSANRREIEALNSLGDNANPQNIAKAIKTVLTRDEKKG